MSSNILYIPIRITLLLTAVFLLFFVAIPRAYAATEVSGDIFVPMVWNKNMSPIVVLDAVSIDENGSLTISPGVVVKLKQNAQLSSGLGSITAIGTPEEPIIFTAYADDTAGGDTNGDGGESSPFRGYWSQVSFSQDSDIVQNAEFRYGTRCVDIFSGGPSISNSRFHQCTFGIHSLIDFTGNIHNNIFENNYIGIQIPTSNGAMITHNRISGSEFRGMILSANNNTEISSNIIANNNIGLAGRNIGNASIHGNSIVDNIIYGALNTVIDEPLDLRNNWWGDRSGPHHPVLNPTGEGNEVSDGVLFDPVLSTPGGGSVPQVKRPVIIVPGILGTELYNGNDLVWADALRMSKDVNDQFLTDNLILNEQGNSIKNIETGDIIRRIKVALITDINIFEKLINDLQLLGYEEGSNLFVFPYDWRLDLDLTAEKLRQRVEDIKTIEGVDQVDIVAHSMGGLVVKNYLSQDGGASINKLIFVGTPHLGAPKSGKVLLRGDRLGNPLLEEDRIQEISLNSPSTYQLLPSQEYFDQFIGYILPYNSNILHFQDTNQFLVERGLNQFLLNKAENFFAKGLHHIDFEEVDVYNIAGCSINTESLYVFDKKNKIIDYAYSTGDETVPLVSADYINIPSANKFYAEKAQHGGLPSKNGVRELILGILNDDIQLSENISNDKSDCSFSGKRLVWKSPVAVHVYDESGNHHTGPLSDNVIEYGIDGVGYDIIDGETFIYLPTDEGQQYSIVAEGLAEGTFDLLVSEDDNGTTGTTYIFDDVEITASSIVNFDISDTSIDNQIELDVNGNNYFEIIFADAEEFGDEIYDFTPPEFLVNFDPLVKSFVFSAIDGIDADPEIICDDIQCIAEDWAGNASVLNFYQYEEGNHLEISFSEIIYNGEQHGFDINNFFANYNTKKDAEINLLQKYIVNEQSVLKINFTGSKNQSKIFTGSEEVEKETLEGLKILQLETKAGIILTIVID